MLADAIYVLVFLIFVSLGFWILARLPLPEPVRQVVYVAAVVVVVVMLAIVLLQFAGSAPSFRDLRR